MMGSRTATNEKAAAWVAANGKNASAGTFADAAKFGEIIFNCTKGDATMDIFKAASIENFNGKTVIDVSNPLDASKGFPPHLMPAMCNTHSLGEEIQILLPNANVVKTLNIVNCEVMIDAKRSGGDPTMFVSGNNAEAKAEAIQILNQFNWNDIIDLGDITNARGQEMILPLWVRTYAATKNGHFAFKVVR